MKINWASKIKLRSGLFGGGKGSTRKHEQGRKEGRLRTESINEIQVYSKKGIVKSHNEVHEFALFTKQTIQHWGKDLHYLPPACKKTAVSLQWNLNSAASRFLWSPQYVLIISIYKTVLFTAFTFVYLIINDYMDSSWQPADTRRRCKRLSAFPDWLSSSLWLLIQQKDLNCNWKNMVLKHFLLPKVLNLQTDSLFSLC